MPPESAAWTVRPTEPDKPFLLAADIDGTLLGDEKGALGLASLFGNYPDSCRLAVISGRSLDSIQKLMEEALLPRVNYVGSSVGTELLELADVSNRLGQRYAARVAKDWDLERIYALGAAEFVIRQEFPDGQPRFQAGFYWDGREASLAALEHRLGAESRVHIVASQGMYIDVLPERFGKGELVRFLQQELGLEPERVVVAGDSGNDREMFETEYRGIVPANAFDELKAAARQVRHYQSPLPAGRGVLDGLCHFGFVERQSNVLR